MMLSTHLLAFASSCAFYSIELGLSMNVKTRIFSLVLAISFAFSFLPAAAPQALAAPVGEGAISYTGGSEPGTDTVSLYEDQYGNALSARKSATDLDASDNTTVTVTTANKQVYDVVVVFDGTSSFKNAASQLKSFLQGLPTQLAAKNAAINVDVVNMSTYVSKAAGTHTFTDTLGGLQELTVDNAGDLTSDIQTAISADVFKAVLGSMSKPSFTGSNIEAGIKAGRRILATGSAPVSHKYMVLMTDGGGYAWDGSSTVASEDPAETSSDQSYGQFGYDPDAYGDYALHTAIGTSEGDDLETPNCLSDSYVNDPSKTWWDFVQSQDASGVAPADDLRSAVTLGDFLTYGSNASTYPNLANLTAPTSYISLEKGDAHAAIALKSYVDSGEGKLITLGTSYDSLARGTAMAAKFMDWADSISDQSYQVDSSTLAADLTSDLNQISDSLFSTVHGTLTDTIGSQFDLVESVGNTLSADDIKLSVGDNALTGSLDTATANLIDFGTPDASGVYPYTVLYTPAADGVDEKITLTINAPIDASTPVQLLYTLHLIRQTTPTGWCDAALNESAIFDYTDSTSNTGSLAFPVPATRYFVPFKVAYDENYMMSTGGSSDVEDAAGHVFWQGTGDDWTTAEDGVAYLSIAETSTIATPTPDPTRADHWIFDGWYKDQAAMIPWDFATDEISQDTTLYAGWIREATYTVSYNVNGGTGMVPTDDNAYYAGDAAEVIFDSQPTRKGYTFLGWSEDPMALAPTWTLEAAGELPLAMPDHNVTLYAVWLADTPTDTPNHPVSTTPTSTPTSMPMLPTALTITRQKKTLALPKTGDASTKALPAIGVMLIATVGAGVLYARRRRSQA